MSGFSEGQLVVEVCCPGLVLDVESTEVDLDGCLQLDREGDDVACGPVCFGGLTSPVDDLIGIEFGMSCDEAPEGEFTVKLDSAADRHFWITRDLPRSR